MTLQAPIEHRDGNVGELVGTVSVEIEKHPTAHLLARDEDAAPSDVDIDGAEFTVFWYGSTLIVEHKHSGVARAADIRPIVEAAAADALREAQERQT